MLFRSRLVAVYQFGPRIAFFGQPKGANLLLWKPEDNLANGPKKPLRVYLDSGTVGDFPSSNPTCNPCYDGIVQTMTARDNLIYNGYRFNDDLDHTIGYGQNHNEYWWDRRSPRAFTFLFPTRDEPNSVLDTYACPPQITAYTGTNITWASFRSRKYTLQGSTNVEFSSSMNWSNIVTTPPESLPWSYPVLSTPPDFRFLRIRQDNDPVWFN